MLSTRAVPFIVAALVFAAVPVRAADTDQGAGGKPRFEAAVDPCEHGVKKSICARCNPKLEAVFKAKNDWCPEHARPESQCVICHPELAKRGVK